MPWYKQIGRASALECLGRRPRPPFARGDGDLPLPKAGEKRDASRKTASIWRMSV